MSKEEHEELSALVEWLSSFPQLEHFAFDKENSSSLVGNAGDYLSTPGIAR
ncbi:MAG: hypothetical protein ACI90V_001464 [Bacillariaceae sp.]|jgi:hypothetical protein